MTLDVNVRFLPDDAILATLARIEENQNAMAIAQGDFDAAVAAISTAVDALDAKVEALKASLATGVQITQADLDALTAITTKASTELALP
jgi:hypothetical protein